MTLKEVRAALKKAQIQFFGSERELDKRVVKAFANEMRNRQYGITETWDAYLWFQSGWRAKENDHGN